MFVLLVSLTCELCQSIYLSAHIRRKCTGIVLGSLWSMNCAQNTDMAEMGCGQNWGSELSFICSYFAQSSRNNMEDVIQGLGEVSQGLCPSSRAKTGRHVTHVCVTVQGAHHSVTLSVTQPCTWKHQACLRPADKKHSGVPNDVGMIFFKKNDNDSKIVPVWVLFVPMEKLLP